MVLLLIRACPRFADACVPSLALGGDPPFPLQAAWVEFFSADAEGGLEEAMRIVEEYNLALRDSNVSL